MKNWMSHCGSALKYHWMILKIKSNLISRRCIIMCMTSFQMDSWYFDVYHTWQQGLYELCNVHPGGCAPTLSVRLTLLSGWLTMGNKLYPCCCNWILDIRYSNVTGWEGKSDWSVGLSKVFVAGISCAVILE